MTSLVLDESILNVLQQV